MSVSPYGRREHAPDPDEPVVEARAACAAGALLNRMRMDDQAETLAEAAGHRVEKIVLSARTSLGCLTCGGIAKTLGNEFGVEAPRCISSGSCELSWAQQHREQYGEGIEEVPCSGYDCAAIIDITQAPAVIASGTCTVDSNGAEWRASAIETLNGMTPDRPVEEFEEYDGDRHNIPAVEE